MKKFPFLISLLSCVTLSAAQTPPPAPWRIVVEPETVLGPIKPMNAVSGGPTAKFRGNQDDWRHARIPFGRTHDMNYDYTFGGPHTIDIAAKLANDYGQQVKAQVVGDDQLYAVAARNPDGALAVWISRYSNDNNVLDDLRFSQIADAGTALWSGNPDRKIRVCGMIEEKMLLRRKTVYMLKTGD